ncbi:MAG TPA: ABC transporter substrate-binding protein [Anaerolineales bacterium]|nr:ABC transporter substrate-binding protein [Anaerolineales bacterium]
MKKSKSTLFLPLILPLILAFVLAACGGAATEAPPAEEPAAEEPAAEEPAAEEPVAEEPADSGEKITIMEWSGYEVTENPYLFPTFAEVYTPELDAVVDYIFFAEDPEAFTKIQSGVHVDLVHPCESYMGLYVENGMVQPIDTSRIEHWDDLHPKLKALGQFNGEQYFVPWDWGYESILVRTDLVEEVPDSWADLWDPQYAGKIMLWDSGQANYGMTALALGITDPWGELTPENVERVKQKLIELKPNLLTYWTDYTQTYDMPASGEAWLTANAWQDAFGYLTTEGYEAAYIEPVEGRMGWACGYGILKDAVNLDRVYEFLNAAVAPESAAGLGNYYWYGHANTKAVDLIDDYIVEFMGLDNIDALFEKTVFYQPLTEEQRQLVIEMWNEVKAAP